VDKLKFLEVKRLFKKLEWVEADYIYQSELISEADIHFMKSVRNLLDSFPELNEVYSMPNDVELIVEVTDDEPITKNSDTKDIYRKIVKKTHPDKVNNELLNSLYKEAVEAYEKGDYLELIRLSISLDIIPSSDIPINDIKDRITLYETRTNFLRKTFTWKWMEADEDKKSNVILEYIKTNIK
jgi:hypothetical protein